MDDNPGDHLHNGPAFGLVAAITEASDQTAADLRQLAADAIACARWIEPESDIAPSEPVFAGELFHVDAAFRKRGVTEREAIGLIEAGKLQGVKIEGLDLRDGAGDCRVLARGH